MDQNDQPVLPSYDFYVPLSLSVEERLEKAVRILSEKKQTARYADYIDDIPLSGASPNEIRELEQELGVALPAEYVEFLRRWRYLEITPGFTIDGIGNGFGTWLSDEHPTPTPCLVIGYFNMYADGDQLLMPLDLSGQVEQHVLLYLHEDGPKIELFAPSFSLAVWRMVDEYLADLEDYLDTLGDE